MNKRRPLVDTHAWDAAETLLELSSVFNALKEDERTDLKWGLAERIQRVWEDYCREQEIND